MNPNNTQFYGTVNFMLFQSFGSGSFIAPNQYQQTGPKVQGGSTSSSSSSNQKNK